jgi:hypothetical protein
LPFLRFTRDKRGYETTSLVHSGRHNGRSRQRILYWFRTPPGVKVGRPALDEEAIRWIEEHNPDIQFDWPKILEAKPQTTPSAPAIEMRRRDTRRAKPSASRASASNISSSKTQIPEVQIPDVPISEPEPEPVVEPELEPEPEPERFDVAEAFEQLTHPDAEELVEPPTTPVEQSLGREGLTRLRARYAELLARIAERGGTPERMEELRAQAESLNPDVWVTDAEVRQGIESFEPKIRDLRAALGLRRRRRSRRGGRRHRSGASGEQNASQSPAETLEGSSNPEGSFNKDE